MSEAVQNPEAGIVGTSAAADAGYSSNTAPVKAGISRRGFLLRSLGLGTIAAGGITYCRSIEPFWLHEHTQAMPLANLPRSFHGFRLLQLTDLHCGDIVPLEYLHHVVERVNAIAPDCVVVTGDLVTHAKRWVIPVCDVLARIKAPVVVSFGNHDYSEMEMEVASLDEIAIALEQHLTQRGITVLRNRAMAIQHGDGRVWLVGLEDLWSGHFSPQVAFAGLDVSEPVIALSHNPDTAPALDAYGAQWILSGHTHGGQIRIPGYGAPLLNIQNHRFQDGEIQLARSRLYVSRGIGYLMRVRINCRPEMPCFVMEPSAVGASA